MPELDLKDIQGNLLRGYRSFDHARFDFLAVDDAGAGRRFLRDLLEHGCVTAGDWGDERPASASNIAFTHAGLGAMGVPNWALAGFPAAFREGMRARAGVLGDVGPDCPKNWEAPWQSDHLHVLLMTYGRDKRKVAERLAEASLERPGIRVLKPAQEAANVRRDGALIEHFGFRDGISNPEVEGVPKLAGAQQVGSPDGRGGFKPIPPGEFLLGWPNEGGEVPTYPLPHLLTRNGSYLVYRKLAQDVAEFRAFAAREAERLNAVHPAIDAEFIAAKMVGRWPDGRAMTPDPAKGRTNQFDFGDDPDGAHCPLGSHVRRTNPRNAFGFDGKMSRRRRLIRRGMTYGKSFDEDEQFDRGLIFIAFNAGIEEQFEFVQRHWVRFGDNFHQGNDMDPILGGGGERMVIQGDADDARPPALCAGIPRFVTLRGGGYFFYPSPTALRLIAAGQIEPP